MMHHIENVVFFRRMKVERSYAGPGDVRVQSFVFGNRMAAWYHRNTFSLSYLESFIHDIFHHEAPKNTTKKSWEKLPKRELCTTQHLSNPGTSQTKSDLGILKFSICSRYHEPPNFRVSTPQSRGLVRIKSYSTSPAEKTVLALRKVDFWEHPWTEECP